MIFSFRTLELLKTDTHTTVAAAPCDPGNMVLKGFLITGSQASTTHLPAVSSLTGLVQPYFLPLFSSSPCTHTIFSEQWITLSSQDPSHPFSTY